ncbi:single-stranded DNA-binding protein [Candidatus Magnetoovum chiemensis]|nr:single-stranded DNA-binding protein [Candidatus Magnetoovum chiemensis]
MYNKIILAGNLTKDPELRYTPQGLAVTSFRIAANTKVKQGEEYKDETLFIDIVTFAKQAETCGEFLSKGSGVLVEGRLKERKWEADGQQKSRFEVLAQIVKFLPKKQAGGFQDSQKGDFMPPDDITDLEPF